MNPRERLQGPAIGIIIVGAIGLPFQMLSIALNLLGMGIGGMTGGQEGMLDIMSGAFGLFYNAILMGFSIAIIYGGLKMKRMESYGWALTANILALVPCTSPCCCIGLPIGIWALIVMIDADVKSAFPGQAPRPGQGQPPMQPPPAQGQV